MYPSPLFQPSGLASKVTRKPSKAVFAESQRLSAPPLGLRRTPWSQGLGAYVTPRARRPAYSSVRCRLPPGRSGPQLRGAVSGGPRYCPHWNASFINSSSGNSNEAQPRCRAATPAIFRCLWLGGDRPCACRWCPSCGPREESPPRGGGLVAGAGLCERHATSVAGTPAHCGFCVAVCFIGAPRFRRRIARALSAGRWN